MFSFRLKIRHQHVYFQLEDILQRTKVFEQYLNGRKTLRGVDIFTGYVDSEGNPIYTRDILECCFTEEDDVPFPEMTQFIVKYGKCLEEHMFGCSFEGFYLEEVTSRKRYSLLDELRSDAHSPLTIMGSTVKDSVWKKLSPFSFIKKQFFRLQRKALFLSKNSYSKAARLKASTQERYLKKIASRLKRRP